MPTSRSPIAFMRRSGLLRTPPVPAPRLDTGQLRACLVPLDQRQLDPAQMHDTNGAPPTDRGLTENWPPPQELSNGTAQ